MNIHEYQAKEILKIYGVKVPKGGPAFSEQESLLVANKINSNKWVVKAQIHAGGRGKGGGVKVVQSIDELKKVSSDILGMQLVTHQTSPEGKKVNKLYIEEASSIKKEMYLSILVDRQTSRITILVSSEGGMDIEEVAEKSPEKIFSISIDPTTGIQNYHARSLVFNLGLKGNQIKSCIDLIISSYRAFVDCDCSLLEINPLVVTEDDEVIALDAKMNFDDSALYRQKKISLLRDEDEENPTELLAAKNELSYIKLDGTIGCMVNGAGLAMATMDIIKLFGGEPANFLDVGGGATKERVVEAFKIILSDENVRGILVNIFGGIMRCDVIADGVVSAVREIGLSVPLVVRLEGTNVESGKEILSNSGLDIVSADNLGDAAVKIVKAIKDNK